MEGQPMRKALLVLSLSVAAAARAGEDSRALPAPLSIASEPSGATVFLDGLPRGVTPLRVPALPEGEHRVRLVLSGYLDNSRVLSLRAGEPRDVHVRLTPHADRALRAAQVDDGKQPQEKKGGSKKALWIGLGVLAAGGA